MRGVIAMSAGTHAQAVAYHARRLGAPATIVIGAVAAYAYVGDIAQEVVERHS